MMQHNSKTNKYNMAVMKVNELKNWYTYETFCIIQYDGRYW